jgi:hypothetical protein
VNLIARKCVVHGSCGKTWLRRGRGKKGPLAALVYTRTIVDPTFGFKLTGKITPRDTVAAIYAQDNLRGDPVDVHPDITLARYKHSLKDDAFIGTFYAGRESGSALEKIEWREAMGQDDASSRFHEMKRGFFFKVSYLWRF